MFAPYLLCGLWCTTLAGAELQLSLAPPSCAGLQERPFLAFYEKGIAAFV